METILSHIIPVAVLLGVTLLSLAAEAVLKRKKDLRPAYRYAAAALAAAAGAALFIYLIVIGAGTEAMLPVFMLVLLAALI